MSPSTDDHRTVAWCSLLFPKSPPPRPQPSHFMSLCGETCACTKPIGTEISLWGFGRMAVRGQKRGGGGYRGVSYSLPPPMTPELATPCHPPCWPSPGPLWGTLTNRMLRDSWRPLTLTGLARVGWIREFCLTPHPPTKGQLSNSPTHTEHQE